MSKAVLDGLKPQECKRGSGQVKPLIPYIPEKDKLQEAVESTASIKLTLPTKVELRVTCSRYSRESHHAHPTAIAAIKVKGLQENYEKLVLAKKECLEKLEEAVLNHDLVEGDDRDDSLVAKAVQTSTEREGKECGRAHRQQDFSDQLQPLFGRDKTALEQDPG